MMKLHLRKFQRIKKIPFLKTKNKTFKNSQNYKHSKKITGLSEGNQCSAEDRSYKVGRMIHIV